MDVWFSRLACVFVCGLLAVAVLLGNTYGQIKFVMGGPFDSLVKQHSSEDEKEGQSSSFQNTGIKR